MAESVAELREFRQDVSAWLSENCPDGAKGPGQQSIGSTKIALERDVALWVERCAEKGFTAPTWPTEYGGGGLSVAQAKVLYEEMAAMNARTPLVGMGMSMIGPTLLEYGNDAQKAEHLPKIIRGELQWCQGYSEPNAGSDLAALNSRADDNGDHFVINGQKIWTSGAATADWMFALVRTDFDAPKHEGISFVVFSMESEGVTTRPIEMINGGSPFCQTFFDNVRIPKTNLIGKLNQGWTVGKRLLQHERSGLAALASADTAGPMQRIKPALPMTQMLQQYNKASGQSDTKLRHDLIDIEMLRRSFLLTQQRAVAEAEADTPGAATSIFKYVEANYVKAQLEAQLRVRGTQGLGWQGEAFSEEEIAMCRLWLEAKSISIAGGSNEVQLNIIAKRVLGLPD